METCNDTLPKHPEALAVPIIEDGEFLDLLLIGDDFSFETVTCRVPWLGQDNLRQSTVRLVLLCIPCTESIVRHGLLYRFGLQYR
jgi:hypothetical protein